MRPASRASAWSARLTVAMPGPAGPSAPSGRVGMSRRVEPLVEREPGEDDQLVDRVVTLDVARRVGLRITEPLGLGERRLEVERVVDRRHRAQDEVGRAVDDAAHALDPVGGEVGRERAEDRDPATDRRLEAKRRSGPAGDRLELGAVMGDDVLVGGDHALAHRQRGGDQRVGRLVAPHQLDDDVDLVVGDEVGRRVREELGGHPGRGGPTRIANGDGRQLERGAVGRLEVVGSFEQGTDHLAADRPGAEDTDAQAGAAHDLGRAGRDIRRMVADASERPPGRRRGQHLVGYTPER